MKHLTILPRRKDITQNICNVLILRDLISYLMLNLQQKIIQDFMAYLRLRQIDLLRKQLNPNYGDDSLYAIQSENYMLKVA